jgi:NACHT domain- and WD repeat-containing protein
MPIATRTFRVFVSSTFEDLKLERDALQRDGWPKLRTLCEQHGARFQAIDLRWGVRDEAALNQKTMEICLREIERCQHTGIKPNFIVLLGQRYGWCPLPSWIEA